MLIRPAEIRDAEAIGNVHVKVWNETYRGIMPDTLLDRLDPAERGRVWAERMPSFRQNRQTLTVAEDEGKIIAFAGCGPRRKENLASDGEIYMINIVRTAKRRHTGTKLMLAMADALAANGFKGAGLWVLEKNLPARAFYERLGGTPDIVSEEAHDGVMLTDLAIIWSQIETVKERAKAVLSASP